MKLLLLHGESLNTKAVTVDEAVALANEAGCGLDDWEPYTRGDFVEGLLEFTKWEILGVVDGGEA